MFYLGFNESEDSGHCFDFFRKKAIILIILTKLFKNRILVLDDSFLYAVYVSFWVVNMAMLRIKATEVFNFCAIICSVVFLLI